jgi:hypothetical protein
LSDEKPERERKIFTRDCGFISGCSGVCTGPSFRDRQQKRSTVPMTQRRPWIRFALPAMVRGQIEIGLASGLLWPGAALEQWSNRSTELGTAAALPESVSRHLVSTSVQFGQSAAGKTESDQWPLVAYLSANLSSCRNSRCWLAWCVGRPPPRSGPERSCENKSGIHC